MTNRWIAVAALLALGVTLAAPGAQAAECPTSGKALADAWAADYLPRPAAELRYNGDAGLAELAQWHAYALHQGLRQAAPGSSAEACLKAIDDYYLSRLDRGHVLNMYMAGMLGAAPQGALAGVSQPDRLLGMLGDLLRDQTADAGGGDEGDEGGSVDDRFVGTWDLVDLAILEDGKRVPNVEFNYQPDAWVMTFLADGRLIVEGRMVTELEGLPAGSKLRGAWFTDDGGRSLTLKTGDHPVECRVTDHSAAFLWYQCPSRHDPRFANAFKLQRLSR